MMMISFLRKCNVAMYVCSEVFCNSLSGLPSSPSSITAVTPLNDTSFTVNWTTPDPSYNYTVIWTNLYTGVVNNFTVLYISENTNSYTVTGLSDTDNYNVSVAIVGLCEVMISDPITIYGMYIHMYACKMST